MFEKTLVFKILCRFLSKYHTVIHVSEIEKHFTTSSKPAVIISFDDGHYDIIEYVQPILSKYNLKYNINIDTEAMQLGLPQDYVRVYDILNQSDDESFFHPDFMKEPITINRQNPTQTELEFTAVLSGLTTDKKRMFINELEKTVGKNKTVFSRMISKEEFKALKNKNIEIGSHSHTHTLLTTLSDEEIEFELRHSKEILQEILQEEVAIIAYPNGDFNEKVETKAREAGYIYLLKTDDKINNINKENLVAKSYFRINQYHQTSEEIIANIYGVHDFVRRIKN